MKKKKNIYISVLYYYSHYSLFNCYQNSKLISKYLLFHYYIHFLVLRLPFKEYRKLELTVAV